MNSGDVGRGQGAARRQATVLESVEEIRALIRTLPTSDNPATIPAKSSAAPEQDTTTYRPSLRPSMALLYVLDDGDDSGEIVRIRASAFVIGRVDGNITIPHDGGISGRHAEISRRHENGEHHWYLKDLQSTNGTFVRAATVILSQDQEVLIGGGRFRFEVPAVANRIGADDRRRGKCDPQMGIALGFDDGFGLPAGPRRRFSWSSRASVRASRPRILGRPRPKPVCNRGR